MYSCIYKRKYYKNIGKGSHTVTVLEKRSSPTTKRFKRSHTDNVLEMSSSEREKVQIMSCGILGL